jgi:hypothetical protein
VRLEGLGQLKNSIASSGIELATFRLVAVPPLNWNDNIKMYFIEEPPPCSKSRSTTRPWTFPSIVRPIRLYWQKFGRMDINKRNKFTTGKGKKKVKLSL